MSTTESELKLNAAVVSVAQWVSTNETTLIDFIRVAGEQFPKLHGEESAELRTELVALMEHWRTCTNEFLHSVATTYRDGGK